MTNKVRARSALVLLLLLASAVSSLAAKTVRVAYMISSGYQEGGEGEYKTGMGYEYLERIAGYAGWEYEYEYGGFGELLAKLQNGEVDLMGNLSYTDERAALISYGNYEQGRESFYLYVDGERSEISADDYSTLNGKKVGASAGSYTEELWLRWCAEHGIKTEIVEFSTAEEKIEALYSGFIDASIDNLFTGSNPWTGRLRAVFCFGDAPYYFGVSKSRPDLLEELNSAQKKILSEDRYYNEKLSTRYEPVGGLVRSQLGKGESEWIRGLNAPLVVGVLDNVLPLSDLNEKGEIRGVVPDVIERIESNYRGYGIAFSYEVYSDYNLMLSDLKAGKIDIASGIFGDYWYAAKEQVALSDPFLTSTMLRFRRDGEAEKPLSRIAVNSHSPAQSAYASIYYPECEQILYSSEKDVAKAVSKGEADATLVSAYAFPVNFRTFGSSKNLVSVTLPYGVNYSFAVRRGSAELLTVLNRGIATVGEDTVFNSLAVNSNIRRKVTFLDFVEENLLASAIASIIIIVILVVIIVRMKRASLIARTDIMTGLLNKVSMKAQLKDELKRGGAFFMVDIDDFKLVNDELGHEAGDRIILHFAAGLQKIFRNGCYISRFGGDEFLIFMQGTKISEDTVKNKMEQMKQILASCWLCAEIKNARRCSVSAGVLIISPGSEITYTDALQKADAALYAAKKEGKNTIVVVH